tara:strand:- start:60456 stop:60887 length:432 start_codon:yes stop_codon:yes gene_type:complete
LEETNNLSEIRKTKSIILFDGFCNLCNSSVQFIIDRDAKKHFLFSSLQSTPSKSFLSSQPAIIKNGDSIILITDSKVYTKSSAAIKVGQSLDGLWFMIGVFIIIPKPLRDRIYDAIAKRRYRWFGKLDTCRIPTSEEQHLFIN